MPFYEYECSACGHYVEVLQKLSDPPLKKCPNCGKSKLTKLVSAPVFRLKGAGWYETDFKSEGETKRNLAETAETKEADTKSENKEDKKEDKKEETKPVEAKAESEPSKKKTAAKAAPVKKAVAKPAKPKKVVKPKPAARKKASRR
jgi:putative FmdB family regulatory protein